MNSMLRLISMNYVLLHMSMLSILKCAGLNALWIKPPLTLCQFVAESVLCSRIESSTSILKATEVSSHVSWVERTNKDMIPLSRSLRRPLDPAASLAAKVNSLKV
jgi:hypothetical protein